MESVSQNGTNNSNHNGAGWQLFRTAALMAGVGTSLFAYSFLREPLHIQMERLTFRLPNSKGRIPTGGIRILHLSDTHFRGADWREQPKIDQIRKKCAGIEYDFLVHTGDFLHTDDGLFNALALLDALPKPRLASYSVFGNHDYMTYSAKEMFGRSWATFLETEQLAYPDGRGRGPVSQTKRMLEFWTHFANTPLDLRRTGRNDTNLLAHELQERDIQVLHNRHLHIDYRANGSEPVDIYIAGVDDLTEGEPSLSSALDGIPRSAPTLLLSHNPDIIGLAGIEQADLILSGHTHGGQIVLPLIGALHTHTEYLSRSEAAGVIRRGGTQVYISRGVGEGIPLRFAAAPQIALITVLPNK